MKRLLHIQGLIVAGLLTGASASPPVTEAPIRQRLAEEFSRAVLTYMQIEPLSLEAIEAATLLVQEAVAIDPENPDNWRLMLDVAKVTERDDLVARAVDNLVRLDPNDQIARLMRISRSIEKRQTADERVSAYEALLAPDNIDQIGATVASKLALDLSLLYRRIGNTTGFTDALTRALALDSANHAAAALAAGYFRANVTDPFAEAELLVNVVLSNPTDIATQVALAKLLLENGAYASAARLYDLAVNGTQTSGQIPDTDLIIDQAIAHWAQGDVSTALDLLNKRSMAIDADYRQRVRQAQPEMALEDFHKVRAPKDPPLAVAQAVISTAENPKTATAFASAAIEAYQARIAIMASPESSTEGSSASQPVAPVAAEDLAAANLEAAWMTVWLGQDADRAAAFLAEAQKSQPLNQAAKDRFEGWLALRRGGPERAEALLALLAVTDPAARLGLALAMQEQGRIRDAAEEFLAVARAQPGSLIGIWAANRLLGMVGQRASISDQARRLDDLIATLPQTLDRAPVFANTAISLRLEVPRETLNAYEPIVVLLKITNNTSMPLAIDRDGPIRSQILLVVSASAANLPTLGDLPPIVIDIERQFRLEPRQTLVIPIDLRRYGVGQLLNNIARNGSLLNIGGFVNFYATANGALKPGLYGCEVTAPLVRIEGARTTVEWMKDSLAMLAAPEFPHQAGMLERMALLGHKLGSRIRPNASDEEKQLVDQAATDLAAAFAKLDDEAKAWLLAVVPPSENLAGVLQVAQRSESRVVKVAYLLTQGKAGDPVVEAAKASDDPTLRRFGEFLDSEFRKAATQPDESPLPPVEDAATATPRGGPTTKPAEEIIPKATSRPLSLPPTATPPPT